MTDPTPINIFAQGAPRVDAESGIIYRRGDGIALVLIDLSSKRCEVWALFGTGAVPRIVIDAGEEGLYLDESKPKNAPTEIELPDFAGWDVWMAEICKYTPSVCLVRVEEGGQS